VSVVVDASVVVAALVDSGPDGTWAGSLPDQPGLCAPHLLPVEVANIPRRAVLAGDLSADTASLAHHDLLDLRIALFANEPFAPRIWQLRDNLTATTPGTWRSPRHSKRPLPPSTGRLRRASGPAVRSSPARRRDE